MRVLLLIMAVSLATPTAVAQPKFGLQPGAESANCPATSRYEASRRDKSVKARKLTELPAADAYLAVWRKVGDCEVPIIVRYDVGSSAGRK